MKRCINTVWLRGACILSAILLGTSMGGAWQTASAADQQGSGQTVDQTGPIEAPLAQAPALAPPTLGSHAVFHTRAQHNYTFSSTSPSVLVPLTSTLALQSDSFTASGRFVVTYTAECGVIAGTSTGTWLDIDIELVNVATGAITALPPTNGTADALCTSNGTSAYQWRMSSVTGIAGEITPIPSAAYYVQIRAKLQSAPAGGATGWLGDTSLIIRK